MAKKWWKTQKILYHLKRDHEREGKLEGYTRVIVLERTLFQHLGQGHIMSSAARTTSRIIHHSCETTTQLFSCYVTYICFEKKTTFEKNFIIHWTRVLAFWKKIFYFARKKINKCLINIAVKRRQLSFLVQSRFPKEKKSCPFFFFYILYILY